METPESGVPGREASGVAEVKLCCWGREMRGVVIIVFIRIEVGEIIVFAMAL